MVGKGNGSYLVLLDLSAAFDTIVHDTLFVILETYVGIAGSALQLLKSHFSDRSQRVLIDDGMSGAANLVCGVPQGSVLGPLKLCLYLLPLGAILRYHSINYHIYADDTQLYISFKLCCMNNDSLEANLAGIKIDFDCDDINVVVAQYDTSLSRLLDKLAPLKKICSVDRPMSDWITDDIRALKAKQRKNEVISRKNPLFVNFEIFQKSCMAVKYAIDENKTQTIHKRITDSNGDKKKLFNIIKTLLGRKKKLVLPDYSDPITLASTFNMYFIDKIANIRAEFPLLESSLPPYSFGSMDYIMPTCANLFDRFTMITSEELIKIVSVMNKTTCSSDPFPSKLLMSHLPTIIDTIMHIINLCLSTSVFPASFKSAVVLPLIKKPGLDPQVFKNYRPVSNLSFLSKLIEKVNSSRILKHIADNKLIDKFQSAYRCRHSTETALLCVYNDIVTMVGKDNGSYLVLLDLSAAFDAIDHDTLFVILEKYVGITGSALQLLKSYFSDRSQRVLIDDVMSGAANLVCGVPQGSVLGPLKLCLYLLPLGAILRYHSINYHIYDDDTQLYISFKCNTPLASLIKLNNCISDIRV